MEENKCCQSIGIQGLGISLIDQQKIFQRFYKTNPDSAGFGIGLPMAKAIIERHHGQIGISSDKMGQVSSPIFIMNKN